jgi:hexosaminidase
MFVNNMMPQPLSMTQGLGYLALTPKFSAAASNYKNERLDQAIVRALRQMEITTGLPLVKQVATGNSAQLIVTVHGPDAPVQMLDEDESYSLTVTPSGVTIDAASVVGAMRGLQTMLQLVQPNGSEYVLPAISIKDAPRFRWRGLMIDCGRHFQPVDAIKRTLDGMAVVKLNVFHWHLTEDQGFRMESKVFPKLTGLGSDGLFYTQEDAREIVSYARDRGIRVVPEFEMPGHSTAWIVAYPEFSSGKPPEGIRREFGISPYALDPTREETYKFIDRFLTEMVGIFPDAYVHIGGDETPAPDWKTNPRIVAFMQQHQLKDSEALQAYFNQHILKILTKLNRHMLGWDEILNPALPKDVVIQSWRGEKSLISGAKEGYQGVLSAPYYLDGMKPAGVHYLADPLPSTADLQPEQRKLILGGEVCMWGEQLYDRTIDSRIWPRTAAMAERFWSPENVTDVDDMYRRLEAVSIQLEALGLRHLSQEDAGLRELVGSQHIGSMRTFASVLEPVSFGERYQQQKTSQLTILDHFVDAVRPDPPSRYESAKLIQAFLKDPTGDSADRKKLDEWFATLSAALPEVKQQIQASPKLSDVATRADQLQGLINAGQQALGFLAAGKKAPAGWKASNLALIEAAKKPSGIVRFTFITPLGDLVNAVQE